MMMNRFTQSFLNNFTKCFITCLTRQFTSAEIEELQKRIEAANLELGATQAFQGLNEKVKEALEEAEKNHEDQDSIDVVLETPEVDDIDAPEEGQRESVSIL